MAQFGVISLLLLCLFAVARSDFASDRAECANELVGIAPCLTYAEGGARAPTPDCCTGFRQVVGKSLKCLCVLVKDRNEPELGFKINVTLALLLPSKCDTPANVSDCPRLLNLPKNSTDARVFQQFGDQLKGINTPAATTNSKGNPTSINNGVRSKTRVGGNSMVAILAGMLCTSFFLSY